MNLFWEPLTKKEESVIIILKQMRELGQNAKIILNVHAGKVATAYIETSVK